MGLSWKNISVRRQEIHQLIFYYTLTLLVFTLPFSFTHSLTTLVFRILLISLVVNWFASGNHINLKSVVYNLFFLILVSFFVLHVVGLLYTQNPETGFFQLEKKIHLLLFPLILATTPKLKLSLVENVLKAFIVSILLASFICLGYAIKRNNSLGIHELNWLYFSYNDLTEIIDIQPNYLAIYGSFAILILLYFSIENWDCYNALKKLSIALMVVYLNVFLLLLSGRTQIIAISFILFLGIGYYFYTRKKILKGLQVIAVLGAILIVTIYQIPIIKERFLETFGIPHTTTWINQYGNTNGANPNADVRLLKWQCAWNIIKDNWLIGIGTGDVQDALQIQYERTKFEVAFNAQFNAHNQLLQTWLALGVIGLVTFLACLVLPAIRAVNQKKYLYLSFIVLFSICCLTESTLERQFGVVFFALFNSLFAFHLLDLRNKPTTHGEIKRIE